LWHYQPVVVVGHGLAAGNEGGAKLLSDQLERFNAELTRLFRK